MARKKQLLTAEEDTATQGIPVVFPEWAESAWRLSLRSPNWSEIGRVLSQRYGETIDRERVARWVPRFAQAVRIARDTNAADALEVFIAEIAEVKQQAWADHGTADNANAKAANLKIIVDCAEKEAAALGVVTKREGREHSGEIGCWWDRVKGKQDASDNGGAVNAGGSPGGTDSEAG